RRAVLADAVEHELDGVEAQPRGADAAHLPYAFDLLRPAGRVPPLGAHDVGDELAALGGAPVGGRVVGPGEHLRVLPSGDAEGVQVALRLEEGGVPVLVGGIGYEVGDVCHGAFLERADWLAALVALDPPAPRV